MQLQYKFEVFVFLSVIARILLLILEFIYYQDAFRVLPEHYTVKSDEVT